MHNTMRYYSINWHHVKMGVSTCLLKEYGMILAMWLLYHKIKYMSWLLVHHSTLLTLSMLGIHSITRISTPGTCGEQEIFSPHELLWVNCLHPCNYSIYYGYCWYSYTDRHADIRLSVILTRSTVLT